MNRHVLPVLISLAFSACFAPVSEAQCLRDSECADAGGFCVDFKCTNRPAGGGGGASTGGGSGGGSGGGVATGGGTAGGAAGGGNGGGFAGGVGGGLGGGAGGGIGVDGGVCGCLDQLGRCQTGDSPVACGAAGAQCATCGFGEQCLNGACSMGACGPQSCSGCCQTTANFCVAANMQSRFACGTQGQACATCPMGQACLNGVCSTPSCDVTTCPTGCCANGQCQGGQSRMACGIAGQMCMRCPMGQNCNSGVCLPGGFDGGFPADAGAPVPAGTACIQTAQCQPPFSISICIQESLGGQATGYTGGYCMTSCSMASPCASNAVCITESVFGQPTCRATCTGIGQQSSCRAGYVCTPAPNSSLGFCRPRCDVMGTLSACAAGQTCVMGSGLCQ